MESLTGLAIIAVPLYSISNEAHPHLAPATFLHYKWLQYGGLLLLHKALWCTITGQA
jgi:hypothetical protein